MATSPNRADTPLLNAWVDDIGEEEVARIATAAIRDIENGTTPGFTDRDAFSAYMTRPSRPTA